MLRRAVGHPEVTRDLGCAASPASRGVFSWNADSSLRSECQASLRFVPNDKRNNKRDLGRAASPAGRGVCRAGSPAGRGVLRRAVGHPEVTRDLGCAASPASRGVFSWNADSSLRSECQASLRFVPNDKRNNKRDLGLRGQSGKSRRVQLERRFLTSFGMSSFAQVRSK